MNTWIFYIMKITNILIIVICFIKCNPDKTDFENILTKVGYKNIKQDLVSGGIATIYSCEK